MHLIPSFYGVYLLQSEPKPRSFYIGSSPDLQRRIRQHNRDLKAGGAYRTGKTGLRPWRVLCTVYGFPSKVSALQFEHALQHPHLSRHLISFRVLPKAPGRASSKINGLSIHHRLGAIRLLVASRYFKRMQLRVVLFDNEVLSGPWKQNKFDVAPQVTAHYSEFSHFTKSSSVDVSECQDSQSDASDHGLLSHDSILDRFSAAKARILSSTFKCSVCNKTIDYFPDEDSTNKHIPLSFPCQQCASVTHLVCLASSHTESNEIIPSVVKCALCSFSSDWILVAKIATMLRQYVQAGSDVTPPEH